MRFPVRGFRPLRSARRVTRNVPKPPMVTFRPLRRESTTSSRNTMSARSAETFKPPDALAMTATSSAFVMVFPTYWRGTAKSRGCKRLRATAEYNARRVSAAVAFAVLREFVAHLDTRVQIRRVTVPVSRDLEIAEITDRVSKGPAKGNIALLFEY